MRPPHVDELRQHHLGNALGWHTRRVRELLGVDPSTWALEIGEVVEVRTTVQFQVRDAAGADKDLRLAVQRAGAQLPGRPAGPLLFSCNGRGRQMFGVANHDVSTMEVCGSESGLPPRATRGRPRWKPQRTRVTSSRARRRR